MNTKDRIEITELRVEVGNNTKQLEKLLTNDIPHLQSAIAWLKGRQAILVSLVITSLIAIGGLYILIINLVR